jgi:hypothetical protein
MNPERKEIDWESLEQELFESAGIKLDRMRMDGIMREADNIVSMILDETMPRVDIEMAIRSFRTRVLEEFPGKEILFDGLYLSRFRRIWEQFREEGERLMEDGS